MQVLSIDMQSVPDQTMHSEQVGPVSAIIGTLMTMVHQTRFDTTLYVSQRQAMAPSISDVDPEQGRGVGISRMTRHQSYQRNDRELLAADGTSLPARDHVMIKRIKARATWIGIVLNFLKKNFTRADRYPELRAHAVSQTVWEPKFKRPASNIEVVDRRSQCRLRQNPEPRFLSSEFVI